MLSRGMLRSSQYHILVHNHQLLYSFPHSLELCWRQGLHQAIQRHPILGELKETLVYNPFYPQHAQVNKVSCESWMHMFQLESGEEALIGQYHQGTYSESSILLQFVNRPPCNPHGAFQWPHLFLHCHCTIPDKRDRSLQLPLPLCKGCHAHLMVEVGIQLEWLVHLGHQHVQSQEDDRS